jgi:molybdopterin-guanine dinucleotide biosynthesis protein A
MKPYDTAVIFAGGKSSRMGRDKSLLPFAKHTTLTGFQYEKLQQLFQNVYISTKKEKFDFEAKLIKDCYSESSPLVGLLSIFKKLDVKEIFVLSVDAPFVDTATINKLMQYDIKVHDAIIAKSPSGIQPLCGRYKKSILPLAQKLYNKKNHKLHNLLQQAKSITVDFEDDLPFTNLNYPKEYQEALKRFL